MHQFFRNCSFKKLPTKLAFKWYDHFWMAQFFKIIAIFVTITSQMRKLPEIRKQPYRWKANSILFQTNSYEKFSKVNPSWIMQKNIKEYLQLDVFQLPKLLQIAETLELLNYREFKNQLHKKSRAKNCLGSLRLKKYENCNIFENYPMLGTHSFALVGRRKLEYCMSKFQPWSAPTKDMISNKISRTNSWLFHDLHWMKFSMYLTWKWYLPRSKNNFFGFQINWINGK